jgi:hypothetical protein
VDAAIGKELRNFIVHDVHDMRLLRGLARQVGMGQWLSITQMSYDLPQHTMPPARLPPAELRTIQQVSGVDQKLGLASARAYQFGSCLMHDMLCHLTAECTCV